MTTELIGWLSAAVLLLTLGRQVYTQWRERTAAGVSRWLFAGQVVASIGFVAYSVLVANWVFVVTNGLILATAVTGQFVVLANRRRERAADSQPCDAAVRDATVPGTVRSR
ncbi:MAG: hypothetical protein DIU56_000175 [Pseudomonadota bacterium]|jgi:hypothetical protein